MKILKTANHNKLSQIWEEPGPDVPKLQENIPTPQNEGRQWVSAYTKERAYGGPEEGGWWFDVLELIDSKPVATRQAAEVMKEFLKEKYKGENEQTGPYTSSKGFESLPEGTEDYQIPKGFSGGASEVVVIIENSPGENTTTETPHYE